MSVFNSKKHTLRRLWPTRWLFRYQSLHSLRFHYCEVLKALIKILLTSNKPNKAQSLKKIYTLKQFETVVIIVFESNVLNTVNVVSKVRENNNSGLDKVTKFIKAAFREIKSSSKL